MTVDDTKAKIMCKKWHEKIFDDKMDINFENHNIAFGINDGNVISFTLYFDPAAIHLLVLFGFILIFFFQVQCRYTHLSLYFILFCFVFFVVDLITVWSTTKEQSVIVCLESNLSRRVSFDVFIYCLLL